MPYMVRFPDGEKYFPDEGFSTDDEIHREILNREVWKHFRACTEIPPEELNDLPTRTVAIPQGGFWPDVFPVAGGSGVGVWAVSEALKSIIEEMEPSIHKFYPLELVNRKGKPWGKTYYLLHIRTRLEDFVDLERTDGAEIVPLHIKHSNRTMHRLQWRGRSTDRLALKKAKTRNLHLWKGGGGQFDSRNFFSDLLVEEIKGRDLSKLDYYQKADEV